MTSKPKQVVGLLIAAISALLFSYATEVYLISFLPAVSKMLFIAITESAAILLGIVVYYTLVRLRGEGNSQVTRKEMIGLGMSISALFALGIGFLQIANQGADLLRVIFVMLPFRLLQGYFITAHSWKQIIDNEYVNVSVISGIVSAALLQFIFDFATHSPLVNHLQILTVCCGLLYAWMIHRRSAKQDGYS